MATPLPDVDLGITETFSVGLLTEHGHEIAPLLAQHAHEILPDSVMIYACDTDPYHARTIWQQAATVDLTVPNDAIAGQLYSTDRGKRPVNVYAGYYDAKGYAVLDELDADYITMHMFLGEVAVKRPRTPIGFEYALGTDIFNRQVNLWAE